MGFESGPKIVRPNVQSHNRVSTSEGGRPPMNAPSICPNRTNASRFKWAKNVAQSMTTVALGDAITELLVSAPIATQHNRARASALRCARVRSSPSEGRSVNASKAVEIVSAFKPPISPSRANRSPTIEARSPSRSGGRPPSRRAHRLKCDAIRPSDQKSFFTAAANNSGSTAANSSSKPGTRAVRMTRTAPEEIRPARHAFRVSGSTSPSSPKAIAPWTSPVRIPDRARNHDGVDSYPSSAPTPRR